jgi:uncharacterized membrane protein
MKVSILLWRVAAVSLLLFVFCLSVYRATVQSVTHDEGLIYEWYLDGGVYHLLMFDPSNHVLFTFLAKIFVKLFGISELSLRAASLTGAAAFLAAAYFLCRRLFGEGILFLLSLALLCLNPQMLDFMVVARGYILGIACLSVAMYLMARMTDRGSFDPEDQRWRLESSIAAVLLALSVVSNLTYVVPATALALSYSAVALGGSLSFARFRGVAFRAFTRCFVVPGVSVGLFLLWPFMIQLRPGQFNRSLPRATDALRDLFESSFLYKWTGDIYAYSLGAVAPAPGSWQEKFIDFGIYVFLPLLFLFVLLGLFLISRSPDETRRNRIAQCQIFGGAAIASVALTVILHVFARVNYPFARLSLYLVPLLTISVILVGQELNRRFPRYQLRVLGFFLAAAVLSDYAVSLNTKYIRYNAYDVISRDLFLAISADAHSHGLTGVRVGGTWWYEPEVNFYRHRYNAQWLEPYDVKDRSYFWESPNALAPEAYDYYVFTSANDPGLSAPRVRTVFRDADIGVTVIAIDK